MCNLQDCVLHPNSQTIKAAKDGESDALAGKIIRQPYSSDREANQAYRHAYAAARFHEIKSRLMASASHISNVIYGKEGVAA